MILITGASGNVGKEVLKQIAQTGAQVRAAFQSEDKAGAAPSGVETVTVDYNQPETLRVAFRQRRNFPNSSARRWTSLFSRTFGKW